MPEVTVLVNTYNRRPTLERVLIAYARQTCRDFEVVVADDGSSDGTEDLVARMRGKVPFPLAVVRHSRRGHRRAAVLNLGIRAARGRTVLFTDADSLPRADLVEVHLRRREPRRMLAGGYLRLTREQTETVDREAVRGGAFERLLTEEALWGLRLAHAKNLMYLALGRARRPHNMGLNYSAWREDLVAVNGYDEIFQGWGRADGDVRDRLREVGVLPKSVWAEAVVFHLWHPPHPTKHAFVVGHRTLNDLWAARRDRQTRCLRGLERLPGWKAQGRQLRALLREARARVNGRR